MADFASSVDGSNKIIVPFEFKLGNLENLQNILENLHAAAKDLPAEAREGMEIPRKGGGGVAPLTATQQRKNKKADEAMDAADKSRDELLTNEEDALLNELREEFSPTNMEAKIKGALERLGGSEFGVGEGMQMLMNPRGFIMGLLSNPAIATALLTAGFGMAMLEIAMMQSAPLDKHFKRIVRNEFINMVRPIQRRQTQVGIGRQVIFTTASGSTQPSLAVNSYDLLRRGEINQIESWQIRKGYRW